jgi:hypothetical protein
MSATSRPDDDHVCQREPVHAQRRAWQLHGATFIDGGAQWRPTIEVQGPLRSSTWWLAHAHGFLVDDQDEQPVGVVEDVHFDHDDGPTALVVTQGWGHRWLVIPTDAITEIAPAERRLTVVRAVTSDRWPQAGEHQRPSLSRPLHGALRVVRRLALGRR